MESVFNYYVKATTAFKLKNYNDVIENYTKYLKSKLNIAKPTMMTILMDQSGSFFSVRRYDEAILGFDELIELGYNLQENETLFYIYHQASIQSKIDKALDGLREIKLKYT
ncbi:unnamed protein product [Rotaria sordida]|uniref:Uncharacterized protein n=1 Tax=Rotaria sordida TaxID=392033 RepID=A0A813VBH7_9BILA|nr:unnamed protein product [Rotaria sordida]